MIQHQNFKVYDTRIKSASNYTQIKKNKKKVGGWKTANNAVSLHEVANIVL